MYINRKVKGFVIFSLIVLVIGLLVALVKQPTGAMDTFFGSNNSQIEFVSGNNVYVDSNGKLKLDIDSFSKVGETQYFSITFVNNNSMTARSIVTVNVPDTYFNVECPSSMVIEPGKMETIRFSITLSQMPKSGESFSIGLSIHTEYLP